MKKQEENNFIISADIGGSHVTAAVIDGNNKLVLNETRIRTYVNCNGPANEVLEIWAAALKEVRKKIHLPVNKLAIAMPGPFDYVNGISFITGLDKYESLYGINVKSYLAEALDIDVENIRFRNDAEAFLHGEIVAGAGSKYNSVIGFTLGTGMGSAISKDDITTDANWGSVPFGNSIADEYFSTRWFLKNYKDVSNLQIDSVKELAALALTDEKAAGVFNSFAENFSGFMIGYILQEKPDLIIIGGNISKAHQLFMRRLKEYLMPYIDPSRCVIGTLDEDAALIGAAFTFEMNDLKIKTDG
jgi:glucokinase